MQKARRARVLRALRDSGRPLGVREVAELLEVHPNTARTHLVGLVEEGLAAPQQEKLAAAGRPRTVYAAVAAGPHVGRRNFPMLSTILTSLVARSVPDPEGVSLEAGRAWGRYLSQRPVPYEPVDAEQTRGRLQDMLEEVGFEPDRDEVRTPGHAGPLQPLHLRNCPFREVATSQPQITCTIHLGLMQGALEEMDSPLSVDRLEPFMQPSLCVAHLALRSDVRSDRQPGQDDPT
ncbi:helix-turn-helix domain-containing protein [Dermatophilaceae bacterium Sec6.4]